MAFRGKHQMCVKSLQLFLKGRAHPFRRGRGDARAVLPSVGKAKVLFAICGHFTCQRAGAIFEGIRVRRDGTPGEKKCGEKTREDPAARAQRGQFLLGGHGVTG